MHNRKQQISNPVNPQVVVDGAAFKARLADPEVVPMATLRTFSKAEKLRILTVADACAAPGDIGALLRQEGICSSHLATWRKQRQLTGDTGALERKRGPKADPATIQERRWWSWKSKSSVCRQSWSRRT